MNLSRLEPPAGVRHAVLANILLVAREKPVTLKNVIATNYSGTAHVVVSGFTPSQLEAHQSTRFDVTLTSSDDIPCADELIVQVVFDDGEEGAIGTVYDCSSEEWFF